MENITKKNSLEIVIIVSLVLAVIGLSFYGGHLRGSQSKEVRGILEQKDILGFGAIQWYATIEGNVEEVLGHSLKVVVFDEEWREISLVVPVAEQAEIISAYILPEGASEKEITQVVSTPEGREYLLGERKINLNEIKVGDVVSISLKLKPDFTIEGVSIGVLPVNLLPQE